jgi:cell wall-associated NlpC family hydrolase
MIRVLILLGLMLMVGTAVERPAPGVLATSDIEGFGDLDPARRKLVALALDETAKLKLGKYVFGSADPARGGFDCSGSVYYLLKKAGLSPARSSAAQFEWIRKEGTLHEIPKEVTSLDDEPFAGLKPGDLLFWAGTYQAADGRKNKITHVQIYLGREKNGGPVMVGSSDGRSYRGKARCGFGVFDFRLPRKGSKARFVGYGTPPGLVGGQ